MSLSKRVSLPPQSPSQPQQDLKHRVITCLNKLSDRDTLSVATTELESIAVTLTHDSFAPFLTYLSNTSSSDKSPVRRQCVRILGFLSVTHGDALSPHVTKMLSAVVRRLRDPDSAVRSACVGAVTSIASEITTPSFSSLSKPLVEAVLTEQDHNSQIGSALCLSAAIEAAPDPEPVHLQKLLPRVLKLIKSDSFKAKPALLSVIGSIAGAGASGLNRNLLNSLVQCLVEFLSCEDWAARKAAVEALGRLAVTEKENLTGFRSSCIASLENKRFDKVKVVRESMNQTLELWKEIPDEVPVSPQLNGNSSSKVPATILETSPKERISKHSPIQRSSPTTTPSRSPPKSNYKKPSASIARKTDFDQKTATQVSSPVPKPESDTLDIDKSVILETEKRVTSNKTRFGSRVVPFIDECETDRDMKGNPIECAYENQKEVEDLSRIQKQLVQIENQQSNLLNLLQKFIGSSRSGMNSLETRVNGLEKTLDEISYDFAVSTGRVSRPDSCCMGTEFLSPKYWRRAEGSFPSLRSPFRGGNQSPIDTCLPRSGFENQGRGVETLSSARKKKAVQGQIRNFDRFDGGFLANCIQQRM
ncbi:putative MT-associated protein TORTIFOLIA1/SPIRAL2 [Helianthus annuus]|uniref:MT-associated protein TORTIFOLIA1/SPIRAL2 n=1 Tax=Helianthus annuus TaxID=4232 RepID=A0A9K3HJX3_HELAN|nr:TORTIFOLIA1-like protein 4 [Helianthus annuus]KAF5779716.1 putative MT-associated protein TORTIFOLIA1/SPIRAL2 [Helianthus annuus]KAJ0490980.1 putative MT-associated protein TORTIFOLIA1/SPIRAL2 [Helianthus annuus]KAJ0506885.1 putative MT-associated protein TORTIFOLIA1/SPIRAL2 [Helianthus annuus]KAJ0676523.1 putative MT-associated protein TORTIFOLIA1/SPIRAL2 [Helianthus annuus]KAJ0679732.1 putative MT-associated protein TORTIFOLIA1/SPIRAL2 [Helianthus annuus]